MVLPLQLPIANLTVTLVTFDFAISISLGATSIRMETAITIGGREVTPLVVDPENAADGAARFARLQGLTVTDASVDSRGELRVSFGDGTWLKVPPNDQFEAWTFAGEQGDKAVCLPGGGLATWGFGGLG
jgi:hypothetical protein